jgi:hypothetical protein
MGLLVIGNLKTGAGGQGVFLPVLQFHDQLPFEDQKNMTAGTPVIRYVSRFILYDPHPDIPHLQRAPERSACFARVLCRPDPVPLGNARRDIFNMQGHISFLISIW